MNYRYADSSDINELVKQRLAFVDVTEDMQYYDELKENFRRKGIARQVVKNLIEKAKEKGYCTVMLNATDMGKPLYQKLGFTDISNGMIFKNT